MNIYHKITTSIKYYTGEFAKRMFGCLNLWCQLILIFFTI